MALSYSNHRQSFYLLFQFTEHNVYFSQWKSSNVSKLLIIIFFAYLHFFLCNKFKDFVVLYIYFSKTFGLFYFKLFFFAVTRGRVELMARMNVQCLKVKISRNSVYDQYLVEKRPRRVITRRRTVTASKNLAKTFTPKSILRPIQPPASNQPQSSNRPLPALIMLAPLGARRYSMPNPSTNVPFPPLNPPQPISNSSFGPSVSSTPTRLTRGKALFFLKKIIVHFSTHHRILSKSSHIFSGSTAQYILAVANRSMKPSNELSRDEPSIDLPIQAEEDTHSVEISFSPSFGSLHYSDSE